MKRAFLSMALVGLLTTTGFVASAQQQEQEREQPQQQQPQQGQQMSGDEVFARLDADRDGKLSEAEFAQAHAGASDQEKKQQFAAWDSNRDKSISKEEFAAKYGPDRNRE